MQRLPQSPLVVSVLLFEQFSNHGLANAVEPLRAANMIAGVEHFRWRYLTPDGQPVTSSSGLPVQPEERFGRDSGGDYLFLLPSYGFRDQDGPALRRALRGAALRYDVIAGFDTGAWLMASAGLLDGHAATIHWDEFEAFREAFPHIDTRTDRHVADGARLTCGGASTGFELVATLIRQHFGAALALHVAALFFHGTGPASRFAPDAGLARGGTSVADRAVAFMRHNLEAPRSIPDMARALGVSPRVLGAAFRDRYDLRPAEAYRLLRLEAARRLLALDRIPVAEVATRCGWEDHSAFARAYGRHYGETPRATRAQA